MSNSDRVRELFTEIVDGREPLLRQWLADKMGESSILDFKLASKRCAPLDKYDREHLAEALSGFANSEGGVIVWGVDCKKVDDIDCIQRLVPINMAEAFESSVRSLSAQLCSPGVPGLKIKRIDSDEGTGMGYVVCMIPPVDGPPVMALAQDQHCFFYRDIDSFRRMPHWMVERGFNQRLKPKLDLVWRQTGYETHGSANRIHGELGIRNSGLGIARHVILKLPALIDSMSLTQRVNFDLGITKRFRSNDAELQSTPEQICRLAPDFVIPSGLTFEFITTTISLSEIVKTTMSIPYQLLCEGHFHSGTLTLQQESTGSLVAVEH